MNNNNNNNHDDDDGSKKKTPTWEWQNWKCEQDEKWFGTGKNTGMTIDELSSLKSRMNITNEWKSVLDLYNRFFVGSMLLLPSPRLFFSFFKITLQSIFHHFNVFARLFVCLDTNIFFLLIVVFVVKRKNVYDIFKKKLYFSFLKCVVIITLLENLQKYTEINNIILHAFVHFEMETFD